MVLNIYNSDIVLNLKKTENIRCNNMHKFLLDIARILTDSLQQIYVQNTTIKLEI